MHKGNCQHWFSMPNATGASTFSHHRRIRCKNDVGGLKAVWYNGNIILPAISWYIFYPWRVSYISCFDVFCYTEYKSSWQLHSTLRFSTRDLLSATGNLSRLWNIDFLVLGVYALYLRGPYSTRWCRISRSSDLRLRRKLFGVVLACQDGFRFAFPFHARTHLRQEWTRSSHAVFDLHYLRKVVGEPHHRLVALGVVRQRLQRQDTSRLSM